MRADFNIRNCKSTDSAPADLQSTGTGIKKNGNKCITGLVIFVCGILGYLVFASLIRKERTMLVETGKETVGIVTRTYIAGSWNSDCFIINFSFIGDDTILDGITSFYLNERELFNKAVVGGTYRVRYNPDRPKKSRIYIDDPVSVSEEEYDKLLERWFVMREKVEKSKTWWKNF